MIYSVIGGVFLVLGVVMFFLRWRAAEKQAASPNWPTADGSIVDSRVHRFRNKGREYHTARIGYTYQAGGKEHRSHRITWGGNPYSRQTDEAQATVARYPVGAAVPVHYNPQKPEESVLEPKATGGLNALTSVTAAFTGIGALFFVLGFLVRD